MVVRQYVEKLLEEGYTREFIFQIWITNPVFLKKVNDKWQMCVDFRDLRKSYLQRLLPTT